MQGLRESGVEGRKTVTLKTDHQASKCLILALRASTGYEVQNTSISKSGQYPSSLISLGQVKIAILIVADCVSVCVCTRVHMHTKSCLFATPWTVDFQAPLSMEFSRQEYWSIADSLVREILFPGYL